MKQIRRLLIANRGEIVGRIVSTCRLLGIETITVYAADDSQLPHAIIGDFSCPLAGEALAETYLNSTQLITLAKRAHADAIHPGYGFLSENAAFSEGVTKNGLIFVGPPAKIIADMGDKAASRKLCETIGVPVIPGYHGKAQDNATFAKAAKAIGFPVLVKAAAGGGGKGMRIVEREKDLSAALESARSEALNAFGDGQLLLEKYLLQPRHIEVQVFSDMHGNHLHLFERECSIQRRHQKIIEESPAPNLPEATRKKMLECAIKITSHIDYVGAGTVEFILDNKGQCYFLEMNTRLQVEHPVTEMVTGLDLVRMQLEVAQGQHLTLKQKDIMQHGHAIEARLYAEDPQCDFLPSPGDLTCFTLPHLPLVRCENGYRSGNKVSGRYDPMLAKLAAWGESRDNAITRLLQALALSRVTGVTSNRAFLMRLLDHDHFRAGKTATDFIARHRESLFDNTLHDSQIAQLAAAYLLFNAPTQNTAGSKMEHSAWTHNALAGFR